jgi:beta-phosphoglucomutase-like phosphatase (HAD superfamily)
MESVYRQRPEFTALFDRILTSEDFTHSKPHPDCYLKAADAFGLTPEQCTVFEDSVNGLKAGMAAGMTVVGLLTTNSRETVERLSHYQTENYLNMDYKKLYRIWQDI